jgi:gluconokinase
MLVYLKAERSLISDRLAERKDHFMPPSLIDSQFDSLEEPTDAIYLDARLPVKRNIAILLKQIRNTP